jgi:hypothetical protein
VLDSADEELIGAVVVTLLAGLKGKAKLGAHRGIRRRAFIYGPDGGKLREVTLTGDSDAAPDG